MFSNQTAEVSLNAPIRTLDAVRADKVDSRFVAGSCSLDDNHLHILRFHPEVNQLGIDATLNHPTGAVAGICTSPSEKSVLLTRAEGSTSASLWKIPLEIMDQTDEAGFDHDDDDDSNDGNPDAVLASSSMEEQAKLEHDTKIVDMKWRGGFDEEPCANGNVLTLDEQGTISQWDVSFGAVESTRKTLVSVKGSAWNLPPRMAWDPHHVDTTAVSSGTSIQLVDWRADASMGAVESFPCHRYGIMDLDYNPNKPFILTTAGQDGLLKFWDLRSAKQPVLVARGGHRHWVSRVSYNPFHDQLVLSAGTDSLVNLWRVSTISSAPLLTLDNGMMDDDKSETSGPNVRVMRYEHMDSVYAVSWGAADAWIYATVGYDGKVVLNHVPSKEKYKILL